MSDHFEVEIVFTGLCAFINMKREHPGILDPAVILVRTPADPGVRHVPFIAFDSHHVRLESNSSGFRPVEKANNFLYRVLDGVQIDIANDASGYPVILPSFRYVADRDACWGEAKEHWDSHYVPPRDQRPDPCVVAAYLPFGGGDVSAERMTDVPWEFIKYGGGCTNRGYYAQEVLYRLFPYAGEGSLILELNRLDGQGDPEQLEFRPLDPTISKVKIWIGNNDEPDIHKALLRISSKPKKGVHFEYLNKVAGVEHGPIPVPIIPRGRFPKDDDSSVGRGSDTGYCGPRNG